MAVIVVGVLLAAAGKLSAVAGKNGTAPTSASWSDALLTVAALMVTAAVTAAGAAAGTAADSFNPGGRPAAHLSNSLAVADLGQVARSTLHMRTSAAGQQ